MDVMSNPTFLRVCDVIVTLFVLTPLTIVWWAGTWELIGIYIWPSSHWISYWISLAIGNLICVLCWFINPIIARKLSPEFSFCRMCITVLFNYIYSFGFINTWRGAWEISNVIITQDKSERNLSVWFVVISAILLVLLRGTTNTKSIPFHVATEIGYTFQLAIPRFRSKVCMILIPIFCCCGCVL